MKKTVCGIVFLSLFVLVVEAEVRSWTSATGASREAEFIERVMDDVTLKSSGGELMRIRMNQLSAADQQYVANLNKPADSSAARASDNKDHPLVELFGSKLTDASEKSADTSELDGKKIGIYFSAQWCPPCRAFTPRLVETYKQLQQDGKPFEIVFVSSDRTEAAMYKYMNDYKMPWKAVRFGSKQHEALGEKYQIRGIPSLVIVDSDGKTLTGSGRADVASRGARAFDSW